MHGPLEPTFFDRPTPEIAQDLLGKFLIREYNDHHWALMITEVEAFDGPEDKASHAHKGRTAQTESMFAPAGTFHIRAQDRKETLQDFFEADGSCSEGTESCLLHIVTGPVEFPAAILIRSALIMLPTGEIEHIQGPTELTRFLKIGSEFDGVPMGNQNALWFEDRDITIPAEHVIKSKRVGIDYAAEWNDALYNFSIAIVQNDSPE